MKKPYLICLICFMFCWCSRSSAQILSTDFNQQVNFTTGKYPVSIATGDIDGDGKPDIVVANQGDGTVSVLRNTSTTGTISTSSFAAKVDFAIGNGVGPETLLVLDINADSKPDIIISSYQSDKITILRNTSTSGTVSFATKVDFSLGNYAHTIAAGDIDGDGKPDLAVANFDAACVSVWRNTSSGTTISFTKGVDILTQGNPSSVTVADLNADSHPDLVVALRDRGIFTVYRNLGVSGKIDTTSFSARTDFATSGNPYAITTGDIDGDGKPDVVLTNINDLQGSFSVFRNLSSGTAINFDTKVDYATPAHPYSVVVADVNGDGKAEVLTGCLTNTGLVTLYTNSSTSGTISMAGRLDMMVGVDAQSIAVKDMDNDGKADIMAANSYDATISLLKYYPVSAPHSAMPESTASASLSSFVSSDIMDVEWKQDAPSGYNTIADNGTTINAAGTAGANAGRFAYFWALGSRYPLSMVQGNLTFSAKGSGTVEVQIIATNNSSIQARQTFTLTSSYQDFNWSIAGLYPQVEYMIGVIFNGGNATAQASGQFKKNFCLTLKQAGFNTNFTRYRADSTTLIGNVEHGWYGWSDSYNIARNKYVQHSAYARMRFTTDAKYFAIEYVRDFYNKRIVNLFPSSQTLNGADFDSSGNIISGNNAINNATAVIGGQSYTISGLTTHHPQYVWYQNGQPLGAPQYLTRYGTSSPPVYVVTAPQAATNLALLVQRTTDVSYIADTVNDTYFAYTNCMLQQGTPGTVTPLDGTIPSAYVAFGGYTPSYISGPAVFVNGSLYKYYDVENTDLAKLVQFVTDSLPAGTKTVEIMTPGQGTYLPADPHVRRSGTYLRAVYFPSSNTTVYPASTADTASVLYIHDSILSGYNISSDAQNNVWMMKTKRDPSYGFKGDIFSEGYAGRILYTDVSTNTLMLAFAQKLKNYGVHKYWFQIGVNDYGFMTPLTAFYSQYKGLVEQLRTLDATAKIYIQSTGPESYEGPNGETYSDNGLSSTGPTANDYRDIQRAIGTTHSYTDYVDFEGLFSPTPSNLSDGIHPTDVGNVLYTNGIKNKSKLLGSVPSLPALAFYRNSIRSFIKTLAGVSVITANGGKPPYTFTLVSGTMPTGLTFNSNGVITGTPSITDTVTLNVKVTDAAGTYVTRNYSLVVKNSPKVVVAPIHILNAVINQPYSKTLKGYLGYGPYIVTKTSGTLPAGITFTNGVLSGTPTTLGTSNFTITATDHWGFTGHTNYALQVVNTTPSALTDTFKITGKVVSDSLIVQGHLGDIYDTELFSYVGAYLYQGSVLTTFTASLVNVEAGVMDGTAVNFGNIKAAVNSANGPITKIQLYTGVINPTTLDNVTISYITNTYITP